MKKQIFILMMAATTVAMSTEAQTTPNKTSFGLRAGVNFQTLNGKNSAGEKFEHKLNTMWHAGVTADVPLASDFYIQPGLLYSRKGAELEGESKAVFSYLELPVNFLYKPALADGRLLLGFGPYVAYALDAYGESEAGDKVEIKF